MRMLFRTKDGSEETTHYATKHGHNHRHSSKGIHAGRDEIDVAHARLHSSDVVLSPNYRNREDYAQMKAITSIHISDEC